MLCDEPTGNLDEETGKRVLGLMRSLGQERNKTFVVVSHNSVIGEMADRVVFALVVPRMDRKTRDLPENLAAIDFTRGSVRCSDSRSLARRKSDSAGCPASSSIRSYDPPACR